MCRFGTVFGGRIGFRMYVRMGYSCDDNPIALFPDSGIGMTPFFVISELSQFFNFQLLKTRKAFVLVGSTHPKYTVYVSRN